MVNYKSK